MKPDREMAESPTVVRAGMSGIVCSFNGRVTPDIQTTGIEMDTQNSTYTSHQAEPINLDFEK